MKNSLLASYLSTDCILHEGAIGSHFEIWIDVIHISRIFFFYLFEVHHLLGSHDRDSPEVRTPNKKKPPTAQNIGNNHDKIGVAIKLDDSSLQSHQCPHWFFFEDEGPIVIGISSTKKPHRPNCYAMHTINRPHRPPSN